MDRDETPRRDDATERRGSGRGTIAAVLLIILLVGGLYWALQAVVQHNALQNCLDSGRRNCGGGLPVQ